MTLREYYKALRDYNLLKEQIEKTKKLLFEPRANEL